MEYQQFGSTGMKVSKLCLGTWQMGGDWGAEYEAAGAAIKAACDVGITFFDTAYAYGQGRAESALAKGLHGLGKSHRDELVIATKGGTEFREVPGGSDRTGSTSASLRFYRNSDAAFLRQTLEESLRKLEMDYIDIYFIHWPDPTVPFEEVGATLKGFVDEGLVRHAGVSNFSVQQMEAFEAGGPIGAAQLPYSLLDRGSDDAIIPYCADRGIGVMGWSALASGALTGTLSRGQAFPADDWRSQHPAFQGDRFDAVMDVIDELTEVASDHDCSLSQLALAWILANPANVVPIVGAQVPEQIEDSAKALDVALTDDVRRRLAEIAARAPALGLGDGEGWEVRET